MNDTVRILDEARLVAILRGVPADKALPLAEALLQGGVRALEITFNTPGAAGIIAALAKALGSSVCLGAGTVLTVDAVSAARDAGARFILAPDVNVDVIRATKAGGLVSVPGAMTATEVVTAHRAGADIIKIFPAGSLGPSYIKNLLGPLDWGKFMVVGGVGLENVADFLQAGAVSAGIGGSLVRNDLIRDNDWKGITELAARYVAAVRGVAS